MANGLLNIATKPGVFAARIANGCGVEIPRAPLPPFARETALLEVRAAEDGWNRRDPARAAPACTIGSHEQREFAEYGPMRRREASVNDLVMAQADRRFRRQGPAPRPEGRPGPIGLGS